MKFFKRIVKNIEFKDDHLLNVDFTSGNRILIDIEKKDQFNRVRFLLNK